MTSSSWYLLLVFSLIHGSLCPSGDLDLELRLGPANAYLSSQLSSASVQTLPSIHEHPSIRDGRTTEMVQDHSSGPSATRSQPVQDDKSRSLTASSTKGKEMIETSPDSRYGKRKRVPGASSEEGVPQVMPLENRIYVKPIMLPIGSVAVPVARPIPLQIISLAPVLAKGVPKVLPTHSWEKKVTILSLSWIYGQTLSSSTSEILAFRYECSKIKMLSKISEMATTLQAIVDSMKLAFGADMPDHPLFSVYGNRVLPELVAMHLNGIDEKDILNSQKHLLRRWTYVLDFIRLQNRATLYKFLLTFEPAIELLDAMIRANLDAITLDKFIRDLWIFSRCRVTKCNWTPLPEALTRLDWFVQNFVSAANHIAFPTRSSADEIQETFERLVHNKEAYTVCFEDSEFFSESAKGSFTDGPEQSHTSEPEEETVEGTKTTRRFRGYFKYLTGHIGPREMEINVLRRIDALYHKKATPHLSNAVLKSASKSKSMKLTHTRDLRASINTRLTQIKTALAEGNLNPTSTLGAWDTSCLDNSFSIPKHHTHRFKNALSTAKLQSKEVEKFLYMLSSLREEKMTNYSFLKICEVFALSHTFWQNGDGVIILLAEILPMLILGNHSVIPNQALRYKPPLRHILEYVYIDSNDKANELKRYSSVRRTLGELCMRTQDSYFQ